MLHIIRQKEREKKVRGTFFVILKKLHQIQIKKNIQTKRYKVYCTTETKCFNYETGIFDFHVYLSIFQYL